MPTHSNYVGQTGPVIRVGLSVGNAYRKLKQGGPGGTFDALIDSGATRTAITPQVQNVLRAQLRGWAPIQQPGSPPIWRQLVDIRLQFEGRKANLRWFDLTAVVTPIATPDIDVLIGADVLGKVVFTWNGPRRQFTISYGP